MISKIRRALLALGALSLCAFLGQAQAATTLDFSGNICGAAGNSACANFSQIGQNYGDSAGIDVSYRSLTGPGNGTQQEAFLKWWDTYSDLAGVVWGGFGTTSGVSEIRFDPAPGFEVTILSLEIGSYLNATRDSQLTIFSDDFSSTPYPSEAFTVAATHLDRSFSLPFSSDGYRIQWGPDGYDVGLDNIVFDVRQTENGNHRVPEPASLALLGAGLTGLAAYRRWRRRD